MRNGLLDFSGCYVIIVVVIAILLFLPLGVSEIYVENGPLNNYNVGDEVGFMFIIEEDLPVQGYVGAEMICGEEGDIIFKEFISFADKRSENFSIISLAESDSECFIRVTFLEEEWVSDEFNISSALEVDVVLNSKVFLPGELFVVSGYVKKFNGGNFDYFIDFSFGESYSDKIGFNETNFYFNLSFADDIPSGIYDIKISFVDKDLFGNIINEGVFLDEVEILSKVTSIEIESLEKVKPPYDLPISVNLFDQSLQEMLGENVILKIYDNNNNIVFDDLVVSGGNVSFSFLGDSGIGGWKINAVYADLKAVKSVYVSENKEVRIDFDNASSSVVVTNIGNIEYEGVITVNLENGEGSRDVPINVDLSIGDSSTLSIDSDDGEYNLSVEGYEFKNVYITGAVISAAMLSDSRVIFVFVIVILLLIVLLLYLGYKHKKSLGGGKIRRRSFGGEAGEGKMHEIKEDRAVTNSDRVVLKRQRKRSEEGEKMNEEMMIRGEIKAMMDDKAIFRDERRHEEMRIKNEKSVRIDNEMRIRDERKTRIREEKARQKDEKKRIKNEERMMNDGKSRGKMIREKIGLKVGSFFRKKKSNVPLKSDVGGVKVYGLLFGNSDYKDLSDIFRRYGLKSYNVGGVRFCLLKSSKDLENRLVRLSKMIINETKTKNLLLHSMSLKNSLRFNDFFISIGNVLLEDSGLVISEDIYHKLGNKKEFVFWRSFGAGENTIQLYKMK